MRGAIYAQNQVVARRVFAVLVATLAVLWFGSAAAAPSATDSLQQGLELVSAPCASAFHNEVARDVAFAGQNGFGTLNVNSNPPTRVYIDGVAIGTTPLRGLRISVGKHRIELVNKQHGIRSVKTIKVRAGGDQNDLLPVKSDN